MGASLEDITKKASQKSDFRTAQRDAALKEVKARKAANKNKSGGKGKSGGAGAKGKQFQKVPKHMGGKGGKGSRGGTQR